MGMMEAAIEQAAMEPQRRALEQWAQRKADEHPMVCPHGHGALCVESRRRSRKVLSRFGRITFMRGYGFCSLCQAHVHPADVAFGLARNAPASPRVQEICALMALRAPAGQAQEDTQRLTGINLDASTIHREARRQGDRALTLRDADTDLADTAAGSAQLAARSTVPDKPFTLIIEIDAWNIRERDQWGQTQKLRKGGEEPTRWHWVYTGTVFRLDQRATTASGRPVISERRYVATRGGVDELRRQLYAEALQCGLLQAEHVLVLADGAAWIWNLVHDRFKDAKQRLDLYHVREHLRTLANALFGTGTEPCNAWVTPYLTWLDKRTNGALDVLHGLEGLRAVIDQFSVEQQEAIEREIGYFTEHKDRMDYKHGKAIGQPVGSGAIESTCSQYQRRFKLTGQFWSLEGDEAFLALFTLHHNHRWKSLFPHNST